MKTYILAGLLLCVPHTMLWAQENNDKIRLSGSVQSDVLIPQNDEKTGASKASGSSSPTLMWMLTLQATM